jgi:YjbE family integral membrane protein
MGIDSVFHFLAVTLEVFFLDLLLSGDNAVVIALASRSLEPQQRRQALIAGTGIAIGLRVVLTLLATFVLRLPMLKLLGGIALTVIAIKLTIEEQRGAAERPLLAREGDLISALGTIVLADLVMSTDNVVALAAVARGSVAVLVLGLLMSVPLLMFGSWYVTKLLVRYPKLIPLGAALLGWLAGDIAISDPLYADWIARQSPALSVVVPILVAGYVLAQSRIIDGSRASAAALRPHPRVARPALLLTAHADAKPAPLEETNARSAAVAVTAPPHAENQSQAGTNYRWLLAPAIILLVMGVGFAALSSNWMPMAAGLNQYDCSTKGFSIYYRMGASRIRVTSPGASAGGTVLPDNQIDWGNLHAASVALGFVPPTRVVFADAKTLRVEGGMFDELTCQVR